jgi:hypothetical protein
VVARRQAVLRREAGGGRSLAQLVAQIRSIGERLALLARVLAVAETVAYAQHHGVIHRDLEP